MTRRIRWQILIAAVSSLLVLGLMSYLALSTIVASQPLQGGEYIEGLSAPPQQLNPLLGDAARDPSGADIQALIFDGLMRIGPDGGPEPALAQAEPELSANGTVYTFTLRTDVTWHDGTPLTAEDVLFTLRAVQGRGFAGDPAAGALWRGVLVEKVGEYSVRCTLSAPFAPFLSRATFPILPAHLLRGIPPEQWSITPFSHQPIGTGPYQLAELTGERALLTANPRYYNGRPLIDSIEFRFFNDSQAALAALTRGEIMGLGFLSTNELGQSNMPRGIVRHELPLDSYTILTPNLREGPLADLELRRALARGLDKDTLIQRALGGQAARLDTPILPGWAGADEGVTWYLYDPQRAANELDMLGWTLGSDDVRVKGGQRLEFELITDSVPDRVAAAQEIAQQWSAIGVRVVIQQLDGPTMAQRMDAHDFELALNGWQRLGPDPDVYSLWHSSQAVRGDNYAGLADDQIDELLSNARQELDPVLRAGSYAAFQQRWVELAPSITLYQPVFVYATDRQLEGLGFSTNAPNQIPAEGGSSDISGNHLLIGREGRYRSVLLWSLHSTRQIRGVLEQR
jgi:peptide/nickel transport system substrate-binding protein